MGTHPTRDARKHGSSAWTEIEADRRNFDTVVARRLLFGGDHATSMLCDRCGDCLFVSNGAVAGAGARLRFAAVRTSVRRGWAMYAPR